MFAQHLRGAARAHAAAAFAAARLARGGGGGRAAACPAGHAARQAHGLACARPAWQGRQAPPGPGGAHAALPRRVAGAQLQPARNYADEPKRKRAKFVDKCTIYVKGGHGGQVGGGQLLPGRGGPRVRAHGARVARCRPLFPTAPWPLCCPGRGMRSRPWFPYTTAVWFTQGNRSQSRPGGGGGHVVLQANHKLTCVAHIAAGCVRIYGSSIHAHTHTLRRTAHPASAHAAPRTPCLLTTPYLRSCACSMAHAVRSRGPPCRAQPVARGGTGRRKRQEADSVVRRRRLVWRRERNRARPLYPLRKCPVLLAAAWRGRGVYVCARARGGGRGIVTRVAPQPFDRRRHAGGAARDGHHVRVGPLHQQVLLRAPPRVAPPCTSTRALVLLGAGCSASPLCPPLSTRSCTSCCWAPPAQQRASVLSLCGHNVFARRGYLNSRLPSRVPSPPCSWVRWLPLKCVACPCSAPLCGMLGGRRDQLGGRAVRGGAGRGGRLLKHKRAGPSIVTRPRVE